MNNGPTIRRRRQTPLVQKLTSSARRRRNSSRYRRQCSPARNWRPVPQAPQQLTDSITTASPTTGNRQWLNPSNGTDWKGLSGGYTRLEQYLNELGAYEATKSTAGGVWTNAATWGGAVPTFSDTAVATGGITHASGNAFARRLALDGSSTASGGTIDVFDTMTIGATGAGSLTISGAVVSAGQILVSSPGQTGFAGSSTAARSDRRHRHRRRGSVHGMERRLDPRDRRSKDRSLHRPGRRGRHD
jgi:hypothetical protein